MGRGNGCARGSIYPGYTRPRGRLSEAIIVTVSRAHTKPPADVNVGLQLPSSPDENALPSAARRLTVPTLGLVRGWETDRRMGPKAPCVPWPRPEELAKATLPAVVQRRRTDPDAQRTTSRSEQAAGRWVVRRCALFPLRSLNSSA
jgi:hypothetical protein